MKTLLLLTGLVALVWASTVDVKLSKQPNLKQGTKEVLQLQRAVLRLFRNVKEPNLYSDQVKIGETYDIEANIESYTNTQAVREFMDLNRLGFMPKGEIFSIFYREHRRQAVSLFKILYYAKDYATLYKTACWARLFMNEGMFVYALSVALVQRPDTAFIQLPPIYEITPEYFYNTDVIRQAQKAKEMRRDLPTTPMDVHKESTEKSWQGEPWQEQLNQRFDQDESGFMPMGRTTQQMEDMLVNKRITETMPPWYTVFADPMRMNENWLNHWRQQQYIQEQLRLEKLQQEKLRQERLRQRELEMTQEQDTKMPEKFVGITIDANYSTYSDQLSEDYKMNYFMEDVGLNAYYYYYNIYFPFWLPNDMVYLRTERRGEQFYHMIQQLLARYYLERLSNGLGNIPTLNYLMPIRTGYRPMMSYGNGMRFPERPNNLFVAMERTLEELPADNNYTNSYMFVRDYERRIRDAIDLGYVITPSGKQLPLYDPRGFEMLGNMIEGNMESPNMRFYGCLQMFARYLLGNSKYTLDNYIVAPSVLEHFETSLRDPVFYQFYKRMITYFQRYMHFIPPYSTKELLMPGVRIQDVEVDRLITYFDYFYADISNAVRNVKYDENKEEIPIRVRQLRLNNRPFKYVLNVMCDKTYDAVVKVFLGPKYDQNGRRFDITENRLNFVELDKFQVELQPGLNRVQRNSRQSYYCRDRTSQRELYKLVMTDLNRSGLPEYEPREPELGMPKRLLLPKGTKKGQMYQMYFIITPYRPMKELLTKKTLDMPMMNVGRIVDNYPLGYPLDRPIDESVFYVPNSMFKDVMIYNMNMEDMRKMKM